jgi:alcohol dehydrogenase
VGVQALVFDGSLVMRELPRPEPAPGEALVRVRMAGICNTDLEITRGYMGFRGVLGHELLGVVEACEDADWVGRRVVGEINLACRRCEWCERGLSRHCPTRTVLGIRHKDGCFAEYVTMPLANLHVVPESVADERAVFVEPLAAAFEIAEQIDLSRHADALVLGDGKLGLLAAMVLRRHGLEVTVAGRHDRKLALARNVGAQTLATHDIPERAFDLVVEATGAPDGLALALKSIEPRGTVVLKSTFHGSAELVTTPIVVDEITVVGSRCGPFAPALAALKERTIDPFSLVDGSYALADAPAALARAATPGVLKVLLDLR